MKKYIYTIAALAASLMAYASVPRNAAELYEAATKEFDSNHVEASLSLYLQADSAYRAEGLSNTAEYAQALHSTGRAYLNANDIQNGREFTRQAMELRERLFGKASEKYIVSLNNYALSYLIAGEPAEALKYGKEVIDLCGKMNPPHPDEGMYLINLGRIYHAMNDDASAVRYIEEALTKVEKFGSNYEYALNFLGNAYMEAEDNVNMNCIMGLMEEHNRHELEKECDDPECHLQRAMYYYSTGDPAHAKDEYMAVFAMPLTDGQKAEACKGYAEFLTSQNDYALAGDYYVMAADALAADQGMTSEDAVSLVKQAGNCYFIGKEYDKSIESHSRVAADVDRYGFSEKHKASSLLGLGNAYSAKKEYGKAADAFRDLIGHLRSNGHEDEADYAKAYERLATAEKFNRDYDASIADYETAIELYGRLGMHDEQQQASDGLRMCKLYVGKEMGDSEGNAKARQQRDDKIREVIRSSLNTLEQGGDYLGELSKAQTFATIAGSHAQLGDHAKAIDYYEKYIEAIRPALAEAFMLKNPKERELTWRQELGNISEMNAMIAELPQDTPDLYARLSALIYEGQLLSKGILLSSNVEFDKILNRYGTKEMKSRYADIKANLSEIDRMRQQRKPTEEILRLSRETDAMQLALARESAKRGIFTDFLNISMKDVVDALADGDVAVEFVTLDTGILPDGNLVAAVLLSKEFPTGLTIPIGSVSQIKSMIEDKGRFGKDGYAAAVWGGIMQASPGKTRIFFSPDGILNNVGIEYLTVGGRPMSEYVEMHRLSSTREIVREHMAQPIQYAAIFGNIDYYESALPSETSVKPESRKTRGAAIGSFIPLDNTEREISEIAGILEEKVKDSKVLAFSGEKASKAEFLSQEEWPVNLIHIATHGKYIADKGIAVSDSDAMDRSILAFAGANLQEGISGNEGVVTAAEIAGMSLQDCGLVVLSACESGLGKLGDDGVFGLQRGFKNAGVNTLLVSLNEVADEATADMMISFYRNLFDGSGKSKREALRAAQTEIRAKYPSDGTWASFILIDSFD